MCLSDIRSFRKYKRTEMDYCMSYFAYRDKERTELILSTDATIEDKKKIFYCPNGNCTAHLFIRSVNGTTKAHFAATQKEHPHSKNCAYENSNDSIAFHCSESEFIFDDAIEHLCVAKGASHGGKTGSSPLGGPCKEHPPKTLRQIYDVCRTHSIDDKYGNKKIKDMILDRRTAHLYLSSWSGPRLVEANVNFVDNHDLGRPSFYNRDLHRIYLSVSCAEGKVPLILECQGDIYEKIQTHIYKNRKSKIVVAGVWNQLENEHIVKIYRLAQVTSV